MKIIVLDGGQLNPGDLSWSALKELGNVEIYEDSDQKQALERLATADLAITNKVEFDRSTIEHLPHLKCIVVSATGYNIIDTKAASEHGIVVCNAPDYSTESVTQHVFALLFAILNRVETYATQVRKNAWTDANDWSYTFEPIMNVTGKTMGIVGFGQIGKRVAEFAQTFGMNVIAYHKHPKRDATPGVKFVNLEELWSKSDVISLHVPLNETTFQIINAEALSMMKSNAIILNTGRGPLIDEDALADALRGDKIRAAGLDVMVNEPPEADHPLYALQQCFITPHIAWAGVSARQKLMEIIVENIKAFQKGKPINQVN